MNKFLFLTLCIASLTASPAMAQTSAVKKASKATLKLTTFKADGSVNATGYGAFIDKDGTAITSWTPFVGAKTAIVIDSRGNKYDVDCLYGASDIYDVARLKIKKTDKKDLPFITIESAQQQTGSDQWCVDYDVKSPQYVKLTTSKVETFMTDLPYYIYEQETARLTDANTGAPVISADGQLLGLIKTSSTRTDLYVASARYATTLEPSALSMNSNTLRHTSVRVALPSDYNQALLAIMLYSQRADSINYPATLEEFIEMFPEKEDGYVYKARYYTDLHQYEYADKMMQTALEKGTDKAACHNDYAKMIYNKVVNMPQPTYEPWTLDRALEEVDAALTINPNTAYRITKGQILFSQQKFQEALDEFNKANESEPRGAETYFYAYQCLRNLKATRDQQLEALDSAVALAPRQLVYLADKMMLELRMNKLEQAQTTAAQAIEVAPRYADAHGVLGMVLCRQEKYADGLRELRIAKALGYRQADSYITTYEAKEQEAVLQQSASQPAKSSKPSKARTTRKK